MISKSAQPMTAVGPHYPGTVPAYAVRPSNIVSELFYPRKKIVNV